MAKLCNVCVFQNIKKQLRFKKKNLIFIMQTEITFYSLKNIFLTTIYNY